MKIFALERCAADQASVDIGLSKELGRIRRLDAAAVEDAKLPSSLNIKAGNCIAKRCVNVLSNLRSRALARADCPDRFIGNSAGGKRFCTYIGDDGAELLFDDAKRLTRFTLLKRLAHANDGLESGSKRCLHF